MSIYFSALGVVIGTIFFALSGFKILVPAFFCLVISTLAFTSLRKYHKQIISLLTSFLLMFFCYTAQEEYFHYFASKKIKADQVFQVIEIKEAKFFSQKIILKAVAANPLAEFTSPYFTWNNSNILKLNIKDRIQFKEKVELQELKNNYLRHKKIFQKITNKDFTYLENQKTFITKAQESLKKYYRSSLNKENAELAIALILGNKNAQVNQTTINLIRNLGLGHFFSASGFHLVILLLIIHWLVRSKKYKIPISILLSIFYMCLVDFSPSITRAGIMAICFLLFQYTSRKIIGHQLLVILAAIMLLINPFTAFDIGFQFSYLATLAILLFYKGLETKLLAFLKIKWLRELLAVSLSVQILLYPLVLYYFSKLQIWTVLANIVFSPLLSLITILSFTLMSFLINPLLSLFLYLSKIFNYLPFIKQEIDLDLTSLILMWISSITLYMLICKQEKLSEENLFLKALKNKKIQLALFASSVVLLLATNVKPLNLEKLQIKNGKIVNNKYAQHFKVKKDFHYFSLKTQKALIINNLTDLNTIKNDIEEIDFLFIPNLKNDFVELKHLTKLLNPDITVISTKSKSQKVKEQIQEIGKISNLIYKNGKIFISRDKFWKITN